jgi:energy-coupling factor transporter ATP-binding protein EcfA2
VIENLTIKGFRGIEALEVPRCGRINVVVGRNGSGKTRLLEAAYALMLRANSNVFPRLATLRGVPSELPAGLVADYYADSFATRGHQRAEVSGRVEAIERHTVLRRLPGETAEFAPLSPSGGTAAVTTIAVFESETSEHETPGLRQTHAHSGHLLSDGRWWVPKSRPINEPDRVLLRTPKRLNGISRLAQHWSAIEQLGSGTRGRLLRTIQSIDPAIHDLRVVALENSVAQLRVDYGALGLCPVELLGDGIVETIHYLTMLGAVSNGVALVDEFGAALDARNQALVVRAVIDTAAALDVQLFLSTHSLEVVDAFLADAPADSLLVMQMRSEGGSVTVETLAHDEAKALRDDLGFDLRRVA